MAPVSLASYTEWIATGFRWLPDLPVKMPNTARENSLRNANDDKLSRQLTRRGRQSETDYTPGAQKRTAAFQLLAKRSGSDRQKSLLPNNFCTSSLRLFCLVGNVLFPNPLRCRLTPRRMCAREVRARVDTPYGGGHVVDGLSYLRVWPRRTQSAFLT